MNRSLLTAVAMVLTTGFSIGDAQEAASFDEALEELTAAVRGMVEPQFEAGVGFGFSSFKCIVAAELGPGSFFDCVAIDEEGDTIRYTMGIDDEGTASVVLASQPAAELSESDRAVLEPPCLRFLDRFDAGGWEELLAELHPSLLETVSAEEIVSQLEPMGHSLGEIRSTTLDSYGRHASGRHEMQYTLDCANGPGVARFGLLETDEELQIAFFTVRPAPGSALSGELLTVEARTMLTTVIGEEVSRIEVPFDRLDHIGATVEGTAWLSDGRDIPIRAVQHGRADDFDTIDFTFQVLDVPWMIRRALASRPDPAETIDCPTRTAPDGGSVTCRVGLTSGGVFAVTVARQGGDHRITAFEPIG
jgi:hypothetical protein